MLSDKLDREIEKGLPHFLYFLWSRESYFLEEALSKVVVKVVDPGQKDFNYDVFYPSSDIPGVLGAAYTAPFLAGRRLVVLKDFHQFSAAHIKAFAPYLKEPCETTCMVILSQKEPKSKIEASWKIYPLRIRESDIPVWLKRKAAQKGIKMRESAVDCLMEFVGPDIGLLAAEIEKLSLSGLKAVKAEDIIATTGMMREYTSFNLIDALIAGQRTRAFRILRSLIEGKSFDAASVLGPLNWHYRQFYSLWENRGKRPPKMRTSTYGALVKYLPAFRLENFSAIFQYLHEADLGIKSSGTPALVLEILLIKLLQTGTRN
ncbi:MAG TPA: DNA polymerase III subunit delta [Nitrospirae bacterium]|nr:DNA polymerase III subunit delta [bacterium BMS3Abin10]GBE39681.1 DNA polymerase III subunit delta [bacterium BMS3Bbin08]HDH50704.1 DNA polymerase III subunit delta [Nitrospirota bacterium]HDK16650.1 DNA polymerase III subunit delta [Nitrospirota bacterium]HDZ84466.1 DNA polymerase III subunit delta [Nitrospirota bacterium]